jgi:hypothetical protein
MDTMFDLIIYHHGSLSEHRMEYIGGDIMEIQQLDADKFASWDITNVLEGYLGYRYNDIPAMYYKYDNQSNEDIHGLNSNKDYENMIIGIINGHRKRLHVFVDHEEEEPVEPVPIEVVSPMLLLSQTPSEVEIQYSEDDVPKHSSQPTEQPAVQPAQQPALKSVRKSTREPLRQSVRQPTQQPALKSTRAPNEIQFKFYLEVIKGMHQGAYNYLEKVDPKTWSHHAFTPSSCSDILLNNIAESFNAWVMEARDQPILSCLETIRRQLMNRFDKKRAGAANATNIMCP